MKQTIALMKTILTNTGVLLLLFSICQAGEPSRLQEPKQSDQKFRESYSLGFEFGTNLKWREMAADIDVDVLLAAVRDGMEGKTPALAPEEVRKTLNQLKKKVLIIQDNRYRELASKNLEKSKAFMEANKDKEGVRALPSGLQYKVLNQGSGPIPKSSDTVRVKYRGTLPDGTEFDGSDASGGPLIARVDSMTKGWAETLQLMGAGSKWQVFVPPWLGYGEKRFRSVPPNSVLIYEIELLSIGGPADFETMIREDRAQSADP